MNRFILLLSIVFFSTFAQGNISPESRSEKASNFLYVRMRNTFNDFCLANPVASKISNDFNVNKKLLCHCYSEQIVNLFSQHEFYRTALDPTLTNEEVDKIGRKYPDPKIWGDLVIDSHSSILIPCARMLKTEKN